MKPEAHLQKIEESKRHFDDAVREGLSENQVSIGFFSSFLACNMFELYLHKVKLIHFGTHFKHDWFGSKRRIREKLPFDFPKKQEILDIVYLIEKARDLLCYGNPQPQEIISEQVERIYALEKIFRELNVHEP